jgi:hypothetical protein
VFDCGSITQSDPIKQPELTDTWGHIAPTPNILGALSVTVAVPGTVTVRRVEEQEAPSIHPSE